MKVTFVYERFIVGGIETLIIRMSHWLISRGHTVNLVLGSTSRFQSQLPAEVNVLVVGERRFHALMFPFSNVPKSLRDLWNTSNVVMSFSSMSLKFAYRTAQRVRANTPILAGVFGPTTFTKGVDDDFSCDLFDIHVPDSNKLFMSREIMANWERTSGRSLVNARDWPLPIDLGQFLSISRSPEQGYILSVGRLSSFKTYNLYMLRILSRLRDDGFRFHWHVIGDTDNASYGLRAEMEHLIRQYSLSDYVTLHGTQGYGVIKQHFAKAKVFVGMGTTVIEAAASGIPAIPAIADEKEGLTYGYFADLPIGSCGEYIGGVMPSISVETLVRNILSCSQCDYMKACERSLRATDPFDLNRQMKLFATIVGEIKPPEYNACFRRYLLNKLVWRTIRWLR